jgi:hypothetical protein
MTPIARATEATQVYQTTQARYLRAWELWRQGYLWADIAAEVGYPSGRVAQEAVEAGLYQERGPERAIHVKLYDARLEDWLRALQPRIQQGDVSAIALAAQLQRQQWHLLGYDQPASPGLSAIEQHARALAAGLGMDPDRVAQRVREAVVVRQQQMTAAPFAATVPTAAPTAAAAIDMTQPTEGGHYEYER